MSSIGIKDVLEAAAVGRTADALTAANALLSVHPDCPYLLVWQAILIQVQDVATEQTLQDAETSLLRALSIDQNYLPALEELAHYYDATDANPEKARAFASEYLQRSQKVLDQMRLILDSSA